MRSFWLVMVLGAMVILTGCGQPQSPPAQPAPAQKSAQKPAQPAAPQPSAKQWPTMPQMKIDSNKKYTAVIKTNKGDITAELFAKDAPQTVNNFVFLAREGFYNGVRFHRVMKEFMVQTGDPTATGGGGPGYTIPDELPVKRSYEPGILAMAKTQAPNSGGSQFFLCTGEDCRRSLDPHPVYTQFGKVIGGMDVLKQVAAVPVGPAASGEPSKPKEDVYMVSVEIREG